MYYCLCGSFEHIKTYKFTSFQDTNRIEIAHTFQFISTKLHLTSIISYLHAIQGFLKIFCQLNLFDQIYINPEILNQ